MLMNDNINSRYR